MLDSGNRGRLSLQRHFEFGRNSFSNKKYSIFPSSILGWVQQHPPPKQYVGESDMGSLLEMGGGGGIAVHGGKEEAAARSKTSAHICTQLVPLPYILRDREGGRGKMRGDHRGPLRGARRENTILLRSAIPPTYTVPGGTDIPRLLVRTLVPGA